MPETGARINQYLAEEGFHCTPDFPWNTWEHIHLLQLLEGRAGTIEEMITRVRTTQAHLKVGTKEPLPPEPYKCRMNSKVVDMNHRVLLVAKGFDDSGAVLYEFSYDNRHDVEGPLWQLVDLEKADEIVVRVDQLGDGEYAAFLRTYQDSSDQVEVCIVHIPEHPYEEERKWPENVQTGWTQAC